VQSYQQRTTTASVFLAAGGSGCVNGASSLRTSPGSLAITATRRGRLGLGISPNRRAVIKLWEYSVSPIWLTNAALYAPA